MKSIKGRGGVGRYCTNSFIHVDIGSKRDWYWCGRKRLFRGYKNSYTHLKGKRYKTARKIAVSRNKIEKKRNKLFKNTPNRRKIISTHIYSLPTSKPILIFPRQKVLRFTKKSK